MAVMSSSGVTLARGSNPPRQVFYREAVHAFT
jgi:hypothetical protein